ncbi:hypothetical protein A2856_00050 [Candidatus Uhrbacteria bacterium RIFCSPHIGHO2_01_FULL_63_20]|uniref:Peptidase M15B domain-containing protein n=1 Tax=Candidatus Uhrbacteria bacterium RIFCSPHIGHO2_01_FULL_63_20 TaxID=1802385 RepID=A0A1F7TMP6_9BACT|nr:MAG: hypothetical protein A2856_00050 [Candidatus Uhrbacteria bacterium RIFCSPHIGHO2_01_FULL_63_20]
MWTKRSNLPLACLAFALTAVFAFALPVRAATDGTCICREDDACVPELNPDGTFITFEFPSTATAEEIAQGVLRTCTYVCRNHDGVYGGVHDSNVSRLSSTVKLGCENDTDFLQGYVGTLKSLGLGSGELSTPLEKKEVLTFVKPTLSFDIPGLKFAEVLQQGDFLEVNFLADYITAVYRMLLGVSLTVAIVMIMVGGVQYVIGAGTGEVKAAKERIKNAVIGFVLMLSVYVILFTVNPQLTLLPSLRIEMMEPVEFVSEDDVVSGTVAVDFKKPSGGNIRGRGASQVPSGLTASIEAVAKKLDTQGYGISIASSFRSVEKQVALIKQNCQNPPGSSTCNPKPGRPQTCILKGMDPANCPHTTGHALDIWATKETSDGIPVQCVSQETCLKKGNMPACFNDPCQKALIDAMKAEGFKAEGFCVLASEAWHFEKPKMSSNCN